MIKVSKLYFRKLVLNGRLIDYFNRADVPIACADIQLATFQQCKQIKEPPFSL